MKCKLLLLSTTRSYGGIQYIIKIKGTFLVLQQIDSRTEIKL